MSSCRFSLARTPLSGATWLVHTIVGLSCHQTSAHYCLSAIRLVCTIVALSFLQSSVGHHHLSQNWRVPRYERIALYQRSNADSWMEQDPTTTTLAIAVTNLHVHFHLSHNIGLLYWLVLSKNIALTTMKKYCTESFHKSGLRCSQPRNRAPATTCSVSLSIFSNCNWSNGSFSRFFSSF